MVRLWAPLLGAIVLLQAGAPRAAEPELIVLGARERTAAVASATLDRKALTARGIAALDDAVQAIPGLSMINDQDPGTNIVALRGVTTDRLQQAAIAYVADGVPLADTELFTRPLFDLDRIEVLKGPQGARFGRNAAGGALATFSRTDAAGTVRLAAGDGNLREAEAGLGGTRAGLSWRAAGLWRAADGWIENRTLAKRVDAEEVRAARLQLAGRTLGFAWRAQVEGFDEDGGAAWASSGDVTGDFAGLLDGAALTDPIGDFEGRSQRRWLQTSLRAVRDLGPGELALLLARDDYRKSWVEELDYRPGALTFFGAPLFPAGLQPIRQPIDLDAWTGEARWTGDAGPATLTLGLFRQDVTRIRTDEFGPLLFGAPAPRYDADAALTGLFGGLVVQPIPSLRLEAQLRHDWDRREQVVSIPAATLDRRTLTSERTQPRLAFSWSPRGPLTLYAAWAQAYRAGGFNPIPPAGAVWRQGFAPEQAESREAGLKARWPSARLDAALFAADLENYQNYTFLDGQSVTLSVDAVEIRGAELSGGLDGASGPWSWSLDAAAAVADAEIVAYRAPDPLIPGAVRDYSGRQVPNAPLWTGTAGASLARGPLEARLTLFATGETFFEIDNALRSPAKTWADLRLAARAGPWTAALLARNLTDERWAISAFGQGMLPLLQGLGPGGPFDTFTLNRGRRVSVELSREF